MNRRLNRSQRAWLAWALVTACHTGFLHAEDVPLADLNALQLKVLAQQYEQQGDRTNAAAAYEMLVKKAPEARRALVSRLAVLYAEAGITNAALTWAEEASSLSPDPQAYQAGIYEKLGDVTRARELLERIVDEPAVPRIRAARCLQLAELCEKAGDRAAAIALLRRQADALAGTPEEAVLRKRLLDIPADP